MESATIPGEANVELGTGLGSEEIASAWDEDARVGVGTVTPLLHCPSPRR
jgi:hypothetical protein